MRILSSHRKAALTATLIFGPAVSVRAAAPVEPAASFARHCAACHGVSGKADTQAARALQPMPRDFTQGQFRFRTTPQGSLPSVEDLIRTIREGLPGSAMPAFRGAIPEEQIQGLAGYVRSLAPEGMQEREGETVAFGAPPEGGAGGTQAIPGRGLYVLLQCDTCHGADGSGQGASSKGLKNEVGATIHPTDFRYAPMKGGRDAAAIVRDLLTGLAGTPMPAYGDALLFTREEIEEIAAGSDAAPADKEALTGLVAGAPAEAALAAMSDADKAALRDARAYALANYVLAFDERKGMGFRLFRQRPEQEAHTLQPITIEAVP